MRSNATRHLRTHGFLLPVRPAAAQSFVVDFAPPAVAPAAPNAAGEPARWHTPGRLRWVLPGLAGRRSGTVTPGSSEDGDGDDSGWEDGEDVEFDAPDGDASFPTGSMPLPQEVPCAPTPWDPKKEERSSLAQAALPPYHAGFVSGEFHFQLYSLRLAN